MYEVSVRLMIELETCSSTERALRAGRYMLADKGEKKPPKAVMKTIHLFCGRVKTENGGPEGTFWSFSAVFSCLSFSVMPLIGTALMVS